MITFKKVDDNGLIPECKTQGAAGLDLHCLNKVWIRPGCQEKIKTGISCAIPSGWVGVIKPRSSLAINHSIDVMAGVIDSDYRGEIIIVLRNHGGGLFSCDAGDRVAQMIVIKNMTGAVEAFSLDDTGRGDKGFGSTGA